MSNFTNYLNSKHFINVFSSCKYASPLIDLQYLDTPFKKLAKKLNVKYVFYREKRANINQLSVCAESYVYGLLLNMATKHPQAEELLLYNHDIKQAAWGGRNKVEEFLENKTSGIIITNYRSIMNTKYCNKSNNQSGFTIIRDLEHLSSGAFVLYLPE